jgi:hypothetical protein
LESPHLDIEGFSIFILSIFIHFNMAGAKWSAFSKLANKKFPFGM